MNNYSQIENKYLRKGHVIKKAERKNALHYIHDFVKKRIIQTPILKRQNLKNFSFNTLHHLVSIKDLNGISATAGPGLIVCLTVGLGTV